MADKLHDIRGRTCKRLAPDLLDFYDEFAELQDLHAFFCDAVASLAQTESELDQSTLEGMRSFADSTKDAAASLKGKLRDIIEQCRSSG